MKKIFVSLLMMCATCGVMAQSITSYYMLDAIERSSFNAAFAPERGYFSIPAVGNISMNLSGNLSVGSLVYQRADKLVSFLDSSVSADEALDNLHKRGNSLGLNANIGLLNFGGYTKNHRDFWSFGVSLHANSNFNIPYEFFEFAKLGKASNIEGLGVYAESYADVSFGYSKMINNKLTVGARVKARIGLASAKLDVSTFDIKMSSDEWRVNMVGEVDAYGPGIYSTGVVGDDFTEDDIFIPSAISDFKPAGYGAAIDLGAEYALTKQLRFSLAVNDLGFIKWNKKNGASASMSIAESFAGIEVGGSGATMPDFNFDDLALKNAEVDNSTRFMQANLNAGAEYRLFKDIISVGAVYTAQFWNTKTVHNLTAAATLRPVSWFTLATSYAVTNNRSHSLGFAANISPCWINIYVATDVLLSEKSAQYVPINQSNMSLSLGLAIPLSKRSLRSKYTKWTVEE